jgi:DUF1365 family protein
VVRSADAEIPLAPEKRFRLPAHLAYRGGWVPREQVAALLWPRAAGAVFVPLEDVSC